MVSIFKVLSIICILLAPSFGAGEEYVLNYRMQFYDANGKMLAPMDNPVIQLNSWNGTWNTPIKFMNQQRHAELTLANGQKVYLPAHGLHDGLVPVPKNKKNKLGTASLEAEAGAGVSTSNKECKTCRKNNIGEMIDAVNKANPMAFIKTFKPLQYQHPECDKFISDATGEYGPYGEMIRKHLKRYPHIFNSESAKKIMSTGQGGGARAVPGCAGYEHMNEEERIYFFVSVLKDLSAGESSCRYWETGDTSDDGKNAIGLLQLDSDVFRENGQPLTSQQEIRTQKATGVSNSCIRATNGWPPGIKPRFVPKGRVTSAQSLHNPEANLACGIGIFMRALGEGVHPIRGAYFGPLNRNVSKPIPFGRTNAIYGQHPLCKKAKP